MQYLFKRAQESPIVIAIKLFWLLEVLCICVYHA